MDEDNRREQDHGNRHHSHQVAAQPSIQMNGAGSGGKGFFDDEQVQKQSDISEDFLPGDSIVVMDVEKEQRGQEQQPE